MLKIRTRSLRLSPTLEALLRYAATAELPEEKEVQLPLTDKKAVN